MLSKNTFFPLLALTTMMSFSSGYANDSLNDSFKKHILNNKDVRTGLICGVVGGAVTVIRREELSIQQSAEAMTTGQIFAGALFAGSQARDKINDDLSLKSSLTQGTSTIVGFALPILTVSCIQYLISMLP